MRLGIIGLPQSGKTTIFNALTRGNQPTSMGGGRFEVHTSVVDVPDPRVDRLSAMFNPKKTTYTKVTFADIAGLDGAAGQSGISGQLLNQLTQMDGFILVVRAFADDNIPHPAGSVHPQRDVETMAEEFLLNDLIAVERKMERLEEEKKKGGGRDKAVIQREKELFEKLNAQLSENQPLRHLVLNAEEEKILAGFGFLSLKPLLVVPNLAEDQDTIQINPGEGVQTLPLRGQLEMEIAQLAPDEAEIFMAEYGLEESSLARMIHMAYQILGVQSFFTVGEDEVRAWTVPVGATAPEAAGAIHSDLQKGFIRAEVVSYEDLMELGGMAEARGKGKLHVEGKEYIVKDGDIVHIRFNL
ncbi:MAG: redox-regulated ATPase YchF [Anaerolineales bacterium]|nr:redox-regulated ATPase YchF [Anaerolineales bacterium]